MKKFLSITTSLLFIVSCGGGGGGGGGTTPTPPTTPAPTVNLSADPISVLLENTSTLTWSSTNATSCSSSWTTQTGSSGSEAVTISTAGNNSFSISCTGAGGSRSASVTVEGYRNTDGVVVDGYISGAEVCIDEDESWTCDSSESSTTSDNDGKFTIKYANGNLVSIGGTDLDSQTLLDNLLITHKLTGHSDFKAVTPVTSVAAFMTDALLVNAALGIDTSIDVFTFDPVANKGDGGINDYLYEKGNQLTVLAFALQNITNNLNTTTETTQDYFKAITEEIEKEYTETETKVDIETEAFVTKALDNVIAAKSVTIDETAKANVTKALSGMLPIIQVKSSDDLTTGIIRFAVSTLQTDIQAIANGTATAETVTSYTEGLLNYIAEDQNIDSGQIAPDISAIADSVTTSEDTAVEINVLLNDSYVTSSPFLLSATNGTNGSTSISNNLITYSPDADYNGSDLFSYTLTQGDKTSSADVTITIEAVNDAPSIDVASTIQVEENQTAVTTISVSDVDEDELTLTLGGTDADSFNLSSENVLTFKEAPDYETKNSYAITLSLTDGTETITKDLAIDILDVNYVFSGKVIDGYIDGAEIFIDQNFNFTKDDVEFSATSDSDGAFNIDISDESLAACLQKRPIIAEVPVGAIDSSLGEVSNAYQMILPSIEDSINANAAIYITPFTSLLSDAVIQGINSSNIVDEIDVSEGCDDLANTVALNISNELLQITNSIESSLDISFEDLLVDFIEDSSSSTITEASAQKIAAFFPYFKELSDEFDEELSNIHGEIINTNVIIEEDAISSILLSSDIEEIPLSFNAIYETEPNELGWFIQEKILANGAKVNSDGQIKHFTCFTNSDNCTTDTRNLDALRNASKRYTRTSTLLNNSYDPENYNYQLVIEDEQRVDFDINGNPKDRVCIYQNWLYLTPVNARENFVTNDRYNTGASDGSNDNDDCSDVLANKNEALFVALVDKFDDGTDFEEIDIRITNPIYQNSTFFENKVNNIYQNRNSLDLDPLIQEIASVLRTFKDIENLRAKLTESSTDQISIFWTKRNAAGQQLESAKIDIKFDKNNDYFEYGTHENSSSGSEYTVVSSTEGQQAINDIVEILYSNSNVFNSADYLSYAPIFTSESTFTVDENQTAIGTVAAVDGDDDVITFNISGDDISISNEGVLTFNAAPDYETKSSYSATVTASDGTNSTTQDITVNITNVNDIAPVITSEAAFSAAENQAAIGTVTATDADGDDITFSISGSEINIDSSSGILTFASAPDYETKFTYTATVTASDGTNTTTQSITVNVTDLNDIAPVFTSSATFSAAENQTAIDTVTATDADGDSVTFTVSGSEVEITSAGVLTFASAPDYETKFTYTATVTASDGTNSTTQDITVNVTNVNDNSPSFTSEATFSAEENQTAIGTVVASDADGDEIAYSISGSDITIDASSGLIAFVSAPDYEITTSYSATVTASDGSNSTTQDITVNITDVLDTFKISGTAYTSRYMILDSDVPNTANHTSTGNEYGSAQAIQNPVTIVGHTGDDIDREDNNTTDAYDLFEINLTNNMYVRLEVSEFESGVNDLDLMLYSVDGTEYTDWAYTSESTEDDEAINLPSSGTILIQVLPVAGSSRYKLTVAQRVIPSSSGESYQYQHTYIPNELIIGNISNNYNDAEGLQRNRLKFTPEVDSKPPENFGEENLLKFDILKAKNIQGIKDIDTKDKNLLISDKQKKYLYHWKLQQKLKSKFPLQDFGFNYNVYAFANFSADPDYWAQWHFPAISAEAGLNAVGQETKNIVVAVLDTGSPPTDSSAWAATDFISGGIDFVSGDTDTTDPDSYASYNNPDTGRLVRSHGTHVASTIGSKNDGNYINGFGIKVIPIKVLGDTVVKGGTLNEIIDGINYAAGLLAVNGQTIPTSEGPLKVINMSLGADGTSCPSNLQTAINNAVSEGITIVAASGNNALKTGYSGSSWPALCDNVISVANVTEELTRRADSDFNSTVDIAAPGDAIYAWDRSERIEQMGGTSMAAPIVSGVIANMYSLDSGLTPSEINSYITNGSFTYDLGTTGRDNEYGYGLINFAKSANSVITQEGLTKTYAYVNPGIIDYGFDTTSINVVLNKTGSGSLSVNGLAADNATGLTYSSSVDAEGYGAYTLNFDRSSYPNGLFENKIYFNMSDGTSPIVAMRYAKGSQPNRSNIGKVYIGLYNSSNNVVASGYLELDGSLAFETTGKVPVGEYYYIISTDIDNDGYICNSGEICEIYPLSDSSEIYISITDSDVTGDAVTLNAISSGTSSLSSFSSEVFNNKNNYQSLSSPFGLSASKKPDEDEILDKLKGIPVNQK